MPFILLLHCVHKFCKQILCNKALRNEPRNHHTINHKGPQHSSKTCFIYINWVFKHEMNLSPCHHSYTHTHNILHKKLFGLHKKYKFHSSN